ncbi:MAG: IS630 family transposase [Deltaproteobacteria bacterium]|jgi:transposase|nr:IS630 family transposase [Deltaproteobacteria bacterium]
MSRVAEKPQCSQEVLNALTNMANSRTVEVRMAERAKIVLMSVEGTADVDIAEKLGIRPNTVGMWRQRFIKRGLEGLRDLPRPGKKPTYDPVETRKSILEILETPPPVGQATWDGKSVANALNISDDKVWRVLRAEGICLQRQRSWRVSADVNFVAKAVDIIGLYLNPPQNAIVLSVDEKPSIQAIERPVGYVYTSNRKIVRGFKSAYKRNGALNLFAALEVATGHITTQITERKRRIEFLEFMDQLSNDYPAGQEIHVVMDNYCVHKRRDIWLGEHPNFSFHFTPTSASWLNMVEIWFGVMTRKALKGGNFASRSELAKAINDFISVYNSKAEPFVWRKREVKGSQLRNTIVNLCN